MMSLNSIIVNIFLLIASREDRTSLKYTCVIEIASKLLLDNAILTVISLDPLSIISITIVVAAFSL